MLHTIVPLEAVMSGSEEMKHDTLEISMDGLMMQVQPLDAQQARIVRLLSPDPMHYLNAAYAPGAIVRFVPAT